MFYKGVIHQGSIVIIWERSAVNALIIEGYLEELMNNLDSGF